MKTKLLASVVAVALAGGSFMLIPESIENQETAYKPRCDCKKKTQGWQGALEYYQRVKANPATGKIDYADVQKVERQIEEMASKRASGLGISWQELGPDNIGGRTRAILIDKDNSDVLYAGSVSGGVFRSDDAGGSWRPLTDANENSVVACMTQASDGTIYFGTGSSFDGPSGTGGSGFYGSGIYKSIDGLNFTHVSSTDPDSNTEWKIVNAIAVDPNNVNRIYAGTANGLRVSNDGGATWVNPVFISCNSPVLPNNQTVQDIDIATDGRVYVTYSNGVYYSDDGLTDCSYDVVPTTELPSAQRTMLDIAFSDEDYMWALTESGGVYKGLYKSTDRGMTWTEIVPPSVGFNDFCGRSPYLQCYYDLALGIDPANPERVILGGVQIWSYDGNWKRIAGEFTAYPYYVHSDKHTVVFDEKDPNILYIGSDGGIAKSEDGGQTFYNANRGYNVTQFYKMAYSREGYVFGGTQDNGTLMIDGKIGDGMNTTLSANRIGGGDGFGTDVSNITRTTFTTVYNNQVNRGKGYDGPFASLCWEGAPGDCYVGNFYTAIRLWETLDDPNSQDNIVLIIDTIEQAIDNGNGTTKSYTGTLIPEYEGGVIDVASVYFKTGINRITDNDGAGNLNGPNGSGSVNSDGTFSIVFDDPPNPNQPIYAYFVGVYKAGTKLTLRSNSQDLPVEHTLTSDLNYGDILTVRDPVQSMLALAVSNAVVVSRGVLQFDGEDPFDAVEDWWKLPTISGGIPDEMEFSKDGNHLFVGVGSALYRYSGLSDLYDKDSTGNVTSTQIFSAPGGKQVIGIGLDPKDNENLVVTLGNYGGTPDHVFRTSQAISATDATTFSSIQGDLPPFPVYDAIIPLNEPEKVLVATEYGVWGTSDMNAGSVIWTEEGFARTPVFEIRQQTNPWEITSHRGVIYAGSHGRGIWKTGSMVSAPEYEEGGLTAGGFVSDLKVYPNPMKDQGTIEVVLSGNETGEVKIYNLQGSLIQAYNNEQLSKGSNKLSINVEYLQSGSYFVTVKTKSAYKVNKFVVVK